MPESRHERLAAELTEWSHGAPKDPDQLLLSAEYRAFLRERGASALERDGGPEHLTASCFVVTRDLARVLLAFHRKAGRWLQLGGHIEDSDVSVAAAARREAREESGIPDLELLDEHPVDLDRHTLVGSFGRCRVHWDLGYVAVLDAPLPPVASAESEAVAWWSLAELAEHDAELHARVARALAGLR
jgi:8-oxo-dGTP pyrophosphatase MutT (NUDIX family)